jgi:hypothetical protein
MGPMEMVIIAGLLFTVALPVVAVIVVVILVTKKKKDE